MAGSKDVEYQCEPHSAIGSKFYAQRDLVMSPLDTHSDNEIEVLGPPPMDVKSEEREVGDDDEEAFAPSPTPPTVRSYDTHSENEIEVLGPPPMEVEDEEAFAPSPTPPKDTQGNFEVEVIGPPPVTDVHSEVESKDNSPTPAPERPCVTSEGKIWPANAQVFSNTYFCVKFTKDRIKSILCDHCLTEKDGSFIDCWILTRGRDYGAVQLIWGALGSTKWSNRWNPLSKDIPAATFHHHPCFYAYEKLVERDLYDCDAFVARLAALLEPLAVQPVHENIILNSRFNLMNVFFNQSNLGFCKDRNGLSF